ncbi:N-acetylmuramoyl-L-alanine amidase [hydrothermal vent metagenome]|uniref:N-acetylmuramoyl-L-alanine amidase n=1 Tax=hydrothermal vent metagenome TaxID=652676 RepID=A0A3B0YFC7_9ZZZZ
MASTTQPALRRQILKSVYEDNLYHVVHGKRRREAAVRGDTPHRTYLAPLLLVVFLSIAATYATVSHIGWEKLLQQTALKHTGPTLSAAAFMAPDNSLTQYWNWSAQPLAPPKIEPFGFDDIQLLHSPNFPLVSLFGLDVKTIVIDPGHGGRDPGAVGGLGTYEKDLALILALRLKQRLEQRGGYQILLTRSVDESLSLQQRVNLANGYYADLFISLHLNAFPKANVNFIETYYFGASDDATVSELAARENTHSDYQYAKFKRLIQKIGDTLKFQESKQLAAHVQHSLYKNIKQLDPNVSDHGIKPGPFVVLLGLDVPSILVEIANLSNENEEHRLNTAAYQDKIAKFLEHGITSYLNSKETPGDQEYGEKKDLVQVR